MMDRREPRARWCQRCGAPRNLGRRDCPGCRLLADGRRRLTGYIARHGVPEGGPVELARRADVPLRVVGELIAEGARSGGARAPAGAAAREGRSGDLADLQVAGGARTGPRGAVGQHHHLAG